MFDIAFIRIFSKKLNCYKQCNIENEVDLEVEKERIIIKPIKTRPREGWDNAFRLMYEKKDDTLLPDGTVDDAMENWEWK